MRDVIEQRLASRLRTLGETIGDELPPPVDLELRVMRRRRGVRSPRRWASLSVAAAIVAALTTVAVVHGTTGRGALRIATSPTTAVPVHDSLQPGTVMLSARGRFVISLDATGHTNATMVHAEHGDITYARSTADHRELWYLSLKNGPHACGDVVRADIDGRTSTIVTHAVAFDVSPDGTRLALYGAGDLARGRCEPVTAAAPGRIVVLDLGRGSASTVNTTNVTSLSWSPDGSSLVVANCAHTCTGLARIDVPPELGAPLRMEPRLETYPLNRVYAAHLAFGPGGLYALEKTTPFRDGSEPAKAIDQVYMVDPVSMLALAPPVLSGGKSWVVSQVIPTTTGIYVVAAQKGAKTPTGKGSGLYRIDAGRLVLVRSLIDPGTLTPVPALVASP